MFALQLRNELWKMFGKRRTWLGIALFLLAQMGIILLFHYVQGPVHDLSSQLRGMNLDPTLYISAQTVALIALLPAADLLLPLFVALVGGDLVSKETEDGTLRMALCRPITRLRLLLVKWCAGVVFSALLVALIGVFGLCCARLFFPFGKLFVLLPIEEIMATLDEGDAWLRYFAAHVGLVLMATSIMSLAFMFSCFNMKPAAATILAVTLVFICFILQQIPFFAEIRPWLLTYHLKIWSTLLRDQIPWWRIGESLSILFGYTATFFIVGVTIFQMRDIKS